MRRSLSYMVLGLTIFVLTPGRGIAHNVGVDCKIRGDRVQVEAYFDDDTPAAKAKVKVVNGKDAIIAEGITDKKGEWSFAIPAPGKYVVQVDAGAGHRAKSDLVVPMANLAASPDETISEGPSRAEFTRTPWLKIGIGLFVLGGLGGALLLASIIRRNGPAIT